MQAHTAPKAIFPSVRFFLGKILEIFPTSCLTISLLTALSLACSSVCFAKRSFFFFQTLSPLLVVPVPRQTIIPGASSCSTCARGWLTTQHQHYTVPRFLPVTPARDRAVATLPPTHTPNGKMVSSTSKGERQVLQYAKKLQRYWLARDTRMSMLDRARCL